jgi:hypothetical protein
MNGFGVTEEPALVYYLVPTADNDGPIGSSCGHVSISRLEPKHPWLWHCFTPLSRLRGLGLVQISLVTGIYIVQRMVFPTW